jgi:hypothetical protein
MRKSLIAAAVLFAGISVVAVIAYIVGSDHSPTAQYAVSPA